MMLFCVLLLLELWLMASIMLKLLDLSDSYLAMPHDVLNINFSLDLIHHLLEFAGTYVHHDRKLKLHLHSDSIHNPSLPCCHCGSHV